MLVWGGLGVMLFWFGWRVGSFVWFRMVSWWFGVVKCWFGGILGCFHGPNLLHKSEVYTWCKGVRGSTLD